MQFFFKWLNFKSIMSHDKINVKPGNPPDESRFKYFNTWKSKILWFDTITWFLIYWLYINWNDRNKGNIDFFCVYFAKKDFEGISLNQKKISLTVQGQWAGCMWSKGCSLPAASLSMDNRTQTIYCQELNKMFALKFPAVYY